MHRLHPYSRIGKILKYQVTASEEGKEKMKLANAAVEEVKVEEIEMKTMTGNPIRTRLKKIHLYQNQRSK